MLTGDENIADVKFRVFWQIDPAKPENYAYNVADPPAAVKARFFEAPNASAHAGERTAPAARKLPTSASDGGRQ